jgi:methyl-accepting chemotaxis protein
LAFSVVANEIRELAEATEIATNEMESLSALLRSGFESMIRQSKEVVGSLASIMLVADENVQRVHDFLAQSQEMRAFILAGQEQLATTGKAMLKISDETDAFADQTVRDASLTARLVAKADEMAAQLNELRQDIPAIFDKIQASDRLIQDIRAADAELQTTLNEAKFERRSARRNQEDRAKQRAQRAA